MPHEVVAAYVNAQVALFMRSPMDPETKVVALFRFAINRIYST